MNATPSVALMASDIDVTLLKDVGGKCRYEWEVKSDWGITDYNVLLIRIMYGGRENEPGGMHRWVWKSTDWEEYMSDLRESAAENGADVMDEVDAERGLERVMSWILRANDRNTKRVGRGMMRKELAWWTDELEKMKRKVRRSRRAYQRARKRNRKRVNERENEYKSDVREYKRMLWSVKEQNWRQFVSESGNRDLWGDVYKVCMGKRE